MHSTPVVTVDGPSGAGKGTLSSLLAKKLGWHFLDSGAIYRVLAVAALHHDLPCEDEECVVPLATGLDVSFERMQPALSLKAKTLQMIFVLKMWAQSPLKSQPYLE